MNDIDKLYLNALDSWRNNKGKGTVYIKKPLEDKCFLLMVLQRIYNKTPSAEVFIIVNSFHDRTNIIEYLCHQEDEDNNEEFKTLINNKLLKIYTYDFVQNLNYNVCSFLCILYHIDSVCYRVECAFTDAKFCLAFLDKPIEDKNFSNLIYNNAPILQDFEQNIVDDIRTSLPVEETRIGVDITNPENIKLNKYYDDYISTSLAIFGNFDTIKEARVGNPQLNISAMQICTNIAEHNGWSENLDMSIEFNVNIDKLYNPGNIKDRATKTYDIIRERSNLLSDLEDKLKIIKDIVEENKDKKILIINKRGEFANKVTDYLNNNFEDEICGNYHDKAEPMPLVDSNGNPSFYKSGAKKGQRRYLMAQAQKTTNQELFNRGLLHVLSTSNLPDKELCIDVDIIIITSTQCEEIKTYLYRLCNIYVPNNKITLYTIYVNNSVEEKKLEEKTQNKNHVIVKNAKNSTHDENNFDFVIAD